MGSACPRYVQREQSLELVMGKPVSQYPNVPGEIVRSNERETRVFDNCGITQERSIDERQMCRVDSEPGAPRHDGQYSTHPQLPPRDQKLPEDFGRLIKMLEHMAYDHRIELSSPRHDR